ncbi:MAG TPA: hypothetical protein VFQ54_05130, partial [Thermomicrobiales bacterium]|nr:hypothetical protein [Thermomicrobiales bacterium]
VTTVVATAGDQISIASRFNDVDTPMASLAVPRGETTQMIAFATDGGELWIHVIAAPSTQWKVLIYVR